jgi:hypothetical protein
MIVIAIPRGDLWMVCAFWIFWDVTIGSLDEHGEEKEMSALETVLLVAVPGTLA